MQWPGGLRCTKETEDAKETKDQLGIRTLHTSVESFFWHDLLTSFGVSRKMKSQTLTEEGNIDLTPVLFGDNARQRQRHVESCCAQKLLSALRADLTATAFNSLLARSGKYLVRSESDRNRPRRVVISKQLHPILQLRRGNAGFNKL